MGQGRQPAGLVPPLNLLLTRKSRSWRPAGTDSLRSPFPCPDPAPSRARGELWSLLVGNSRAKRERKPFRARRGWGGEAEELCSSLLQSPFTPCSSARGEAVGRGRCRHRDSQDSRPSSSSWPKKSPRCPPILTKSFCTGSWSFPAGEVLAGLLEGDAAAPRIALRSRCPTPRRARRFTDFLSF